MKKSLLFVMNNLTCGGAEKALVSLLQTIDYSKYEVDLYLFKQEGVFLDQVPFEVNLLPEPENYRYFDMSLKKAVIENCKKGRFLVAWNRILAGLVFKTVKIKSVREQKVWPFLSKVLKPLSKEYDMAIGYLEKTPNYYCIDKVNAKIKIGFIHNDYNMLQMNPQIDRPYFRKFNYIFTISESCKNVLEETFPDLKDKFEVMFNIVSPSTIRKLSLKHVDFNPTGITLVSVGRLTHQKGFDMAIEACKILLDKGIDVHWYVLGEGEDRIALENSIKVHGLEKRFILLGINENPYPFISKATIYVQPSRFEGKSVAIDEAKILGKPIVVTNFPSIVDQITHLENGYITDMKPDSIAEGINEIIMNTQLQHTIQEHLRSEKLGTESEINKLYTVV